ncbi:MAG: hypothetical protein HY774_05790 [Acidobacteria bacterium]|nr:hypothetical protein [Acidobacteriota bacterium]
MANFSKIRCLGLVLIFLVVFHPGWRASSTSVQHRRSLGCSPKALTAYRPIPQLDYPCESHPEDNLNNPERAEALEAYLTELETTFSDPNWWAVSVAELNVCSITNQVRRMTASEREMLEYTTYLYGDHSTRLVVSVDPCIWYSSNTLNGFILHRVGRQVVATLVLDAFYTRLDKAVDFHLAHHNGEKLIFVYSNTSDGSMPPTLFTTCTVYTIDPKSHRATPKKLFQDEKGTVTNQFEWNGYVFEDEKLANQWYAPKIVHKGRLSQRFTICTPINHRMTYSTYTWNGKYFKLK